MIYQSVIARGQWQGLSLAEQLGNIGGEVHRVRNFFGKDTAACARAADRALELFDLTLSDARWRGRRKEIARAREIFCDCVFGENQYRTALCDLDAYFFAFAMEARRKR